MKRVFFVLLTAYLSIHSTLAADGWLTEIEAGLKAAKEQKKAVFVEFTGSDWCPPCMMMEKKVFSKQAFLKEARRDFVLVKIDIPKADKELSAKNKEVMAKWGVQGVPTVLLIDADGKEFHRFSAAKYPDIDPFIAHLRRALELKGML